MPSNRPQAPSTMEPRRLAVRENPPALLLEYKVKTGGLRRKIFRFNDPRMDPAALAQRLVQSYPAYLNRVRVEQLGRVLQALCAKNKKTPVVAFIGPGTRSLKSDEGGWGSHGRINCVAGKQSNVDDGRQSDTAENMSERIYQLQGERQSPTSDKVDLTAVDDLNRVSEEELAAVKRQMDLVFEINSQLRPGHPKYVHDRRAEFGPPDEDSGWDDD